MIVGGGKVAAKKVEKLLLFELNLTVIAPQIEKCIRTQEKLQRKDTAASWVRKEISRALPTGLGQNIDLIGQMLLVFIFLL